MRATERRPYTILTLTIVGGFGLLRHKSIQQSYFASILLWFFVVGICIRVDNVSRLSQGIHKLLARDFSIPKLLKSLGNRIDSTSPHISSVRLELPVCQQSIYNWNPLLLKLEMIRHGWEIVTELVESLTHGGIAQREVVLDVVAREILDL